MPLASASAAVALIARELDGGSPSGSLGFCAPNRLRCLGGGSPTGSLGFCARCPALALLSEGLPAGPHGHCASLASSCSCSAGVSAVGSTSLSSSPPPVRWCHFRRAGFSFHTRQRSHFCCPLLCCGFVCTASGSLNFSPFWRAGGAGSLTLCFPLFFLLSSADSPAKFPSLLEHLPDFVRVVHDIGCALIRYSRHVAVDYPHQPVGLLPHSVALAKALLVGLIACRILSAEDFPRLLVYVVPLLACCNLSGDPPVLGCRFVK